MAGLDSSDHIEQNYSHTCENFEFYRIFQKVFECNTLRFAAIVSHYTQDCYLKEGLKDFLNELK